MGQTAWLLSCWIVQRTGQAQHIVLGASQHSMHLVQNERVNEKTIGLKTYVL